ncbi:MAG: glycosyltransferase family 39 protein [Acidobacteriota bacterium]
MGPNDIRTQGLKDGSRRMRIGGWIALFAILAGTLLLGLSGLNRSLWLDEAWVANSVRERSVWAMLHYSQWLQTSPPLFLLIARAAVSGFGLSLDTLRSVPLLFSLLAAIAMFGAARKVVGLTWAFAATAVLIFSPTAVEHLRSFKQYAGETAATCALLWLAATYLESHELRRFRWLCAATAILLCLSYPLVFLIPGLVLAVWWNGGPMRARLLLAVASLVELPLYWFQIRPNIAPDLWTFWGTGWSDSLSLSTILAAVFCAFVTARMVGSMDSGRSVSNPDWRIGFRVVCLLACFLYLNAEMFRWYPTDPRMRLFLWPCLLLLGAMELDDLYRRLPSSIKEVVAVCVVIATALSMTWTVGRIWSGPPEQTIEEYGAALRILRNQVSPNDLLLVHADAKQGFLLQAAIDHWPELEWGSRTRFGETGWPCCARGRDLVPGRLESKAVTRDLTRMVPKGFSGRVWLFYGNRPLHWKYLGLDEGDLWRRTMWERGCPPMEYLALGNLVISPMGCTETK